MKALEITLTVLLWLLVATIVGTLIWALAPWLVKFWVLAAKVHAMGLQ